MRERNRFLRGMTVWVGYTQAAVPYQRDSRYAGETKYTLSKMLRFSLDAISSFSHRPLQLATLLGFLISTLAFIAIPVVIVLRILGSYLPGFSALTIVVLLLGGIELIAIGIIGEYVGRIYDEVKGRPLYLVRARRNLPDPEAHHPGDSGIPTAPPSSVADAPFPCSTPPRRWPRCPTELDAAIARVVAPARSSSGLRSRRSSSELAAYVGRRRGDRRGQRHRRADVALRAMGVGPAMTSSCRRSRSTPAPRAIPPTGARPVFCDVDPRPSWSPPRPFERR